MNLKKIEFVSHVIYNYTQIINNMCLSIQLNFHFKIKG